MASEEAVREAIGFDSDSDVPDALLPSLHMGSRKIPHIRLRIPRTTNPLLTYAHATAP